MRLYSRRQFIRQSSTMMAAAATGFAAQQHTEHIAKVKNASPALLVNKAVELLGGMDSFVKPGQSVLIKPNIGWDRMPEQAATTNPELVAEVVAMCRKAGAKKIRVIDRTCNSARRCYRRSGIEEAARAAGAEVRFVVESRFRDTPIPQGKSLTSWLIYKDALDFEVLINIPIAKTHNISGVTLGMKNLMGLLGGDRGELHKGFDDKIVDINSVIHPALTIVDAYRILMHNGPSGGSLEDVVKKEIVFAGRDPVAVDAFAAMLFEINPDTLGYLANANQRGLGSLDINDSRLKTFDFRA